MPVSYEIDSYKKINIILIIIIMFVFFYCFFLPYLGFGLNSACRGLPLMYCKSRGLTRAFSQILHLNFNHALACNVYSIKIFSFFFLQLIARFLINWKISDSNLKRIFNLDVAVSVIYFLFCFYNLVTPY